MSLACTADGDFDGLCDDWETSGIDYDRDGLLDLNLSTLGATPLRKNLFVEYDWMEAGNHDHKPQPLALQDVERAFLAGDDVVVHFAEGEAIADVQYLQFTNNPNSNTPVVDFDQIKWGSSGNPCGTSTSDGRFGTVADRGNANCAAILGAKRLVYRYMVMGHDLASSPGTGGIAELLGNDLAITIGGWSDEGLLCAAGFYCGNLSSPIPPSLIERAKRHKEAGTIMHELGHTLGLRHGGTDNVNCKPNYPSVMNYALESRSAVPRRVLDFSQFVLSTLDENNLNETVGLDGPSNREVVYSQFGKLIVVSTDTAPIDWDGLDSDGDGTFDNDQSVATDITTITGITECATFQQEPLVSSRDWSRTTHNFRVAPRWGALSKRDDVVMDTRLEEILFLAENSDYDLDGVANALDLCPAIADPEQVDSNNDYVGDACQSEFDVVPSTPVLRIPAAASSVNMPVQLSWDAGPEITDCQSALANSAPRRVLQSTIGG
jgi:hypothetical protein